MTAPVTPAVVVGLWDHLQAHYRTTVVTKADAGQMKQLATLLDALGVLDRERFLKEYATTIGRTIYLPFTPGEATATWDLWAQLTVAVHEHQHVVQHVRDGLRFEVEYVIDSSTRARHEAEAYLTALELHHWRYGQVPPARRFAEKLAAYACSEADILWAAKYLTLAAATIGQGGLVTEAGAVALDWLDAHAPELAFGT